MENERIEHMSHLLAGKKHSRPGQNMKEMREEVCDHTAAKASKFITGPAKKFKRGY